MATNEYNIAMLLPTRGRTTALDRSVMTLFDCATDKDQIQILFGFDNDDTVGLTHFAEKLQPWLDKNNIQYTALTTAPQGYSKINRYYNMLASKASADWLFLWNDDAVMETPEWDQKIIRHTGEFKLLKAHTHNEHPYSVFPIWPKEWHDLVGYASRHQMIDAELSQIAYMLDIIEKIHVYITHDRFDLTGNNFDKTHSDRTAFEGNPDDPRDFHHHGFNDARINDCVRIAAYLESKGHDMSFWHSVAKGTQDPWEKLKQNDINQQMHQRPAIWIRS